MHNRKLRLTANKRIPFQAGLVFGRRNSHLRSTPLVGGPGLGQLNAAIELVAPHRQQAANYVLDLFLRDEYSAVT